MCWSIKNQFAKIIENQQSFGLWKIISLFFEKHFAKQKNNSTFVSRLKKAVLKKSKKSSLRYWKRQQNS